MLHVPDVRATVRWYETLGFRLTGTNEECGELNFWVTFGQPIAQQVP
jgi:catechol 2,3-dioxygenase-like lactoylglutathione lyase family enzyme